MKNKIAVIITTIKKDVMMMKCLPSFLNKNITIYLLDQGKITEEKQTFYNNLINQGHHVYCINENMGISKARNYLLDKVIEPFILLADDDVELISNPNDILFHFENKNIGIVGGCLFNVAKNKEHHYEYALEINGKKLYLRKSNNIDLVLNFFVARKNLFNDIRWDNDLIMCEHTAFFLELKKLNKWKVIYDKNLYGNHYSYEFRTKEFRTFRSINFMKGRRIFEKKYKIYHTIREQ